MVRRRAGRPAGVEYDYDTVNTECTAGQTFALGRLTASRTEGNELKYCYDRFGQVVRKVQIVAGKSFTLKYAYTIGGYLYTVTYPDGTTVDYARDAQARIKEIGVRPYGGTRTVLLNNATYEPFGPVTGWTYGNGRALNRTYDQDYRPKTILDGASGGLSLGYGYNTVGELTELKDGLQSAVQAKYHYDTLGRLTFTRDNAFNPVETYTYDKTGNRKSLLHGGVTDTYVYPTTSHRLNSVAGVARGYDAAGNTTSVGGTAKEFVYNANDRLSQFKQAGLIKASYRYNADGERVATTGATTGTIDTYTLYDEDGNWIGDYDSTGAAKQQAVWFGDTPVGLVIGSGSAQSLRYVQPDHLGTPRAVIDPSRNVAIWTWDAKSEAFGSSPPNQDPDQDGTAFTFNMRFPGQRFDAASGLVYNYFRDYDPTTGRYIQSDPIGLAGGINSYAYASSRPLRNSDFYGLRPGDCYRTPDIAAANAICEINPRSIEKDVEFGGWIYRTKNNYYSYTHPKEGTQHSVNPGPRPARALGNYHTHGADDDEAYDGEGFSATDIRIPYGDSAWLGTPSSRVLKYSSVGKPFRILPNASPNNEDAVACDAAKSIIDRALDWLFSP